MKKLFYLGMLSVFVSCAEKLIEKPDNLIPKDKMIIILNDLALVNAAKVANVQMLRKHKIVPMQYIFKKHGIDSLQFVESDRYYASLPEEYETMYSTVETMLEVENERLTAEKNVRDSLDREKRKKEKQRIKATNTLSKTADKKKQ